MWDFAMRAQEEEAQLYLKYLKFKQASERVQYRGEIIERINKAVDKVLILPKKPNASEWERFLSNGRNDEYEHDQEEE